MPSIISVQPLLVAAWVELQTRQHAAPTAKLRLAALRHLFAWLVTGQIIPTNPAASVRGPAHHVRKGATSVLGGAEARLRLDTINTTTPIGLRDRALIGLMVYSFAWVGVARAMRVEDVFSQNRRLWVRLREKGGKRHEMPRRHTLKGYLHAYLDGAGIAGDAKGALFRTIRRRIGQLSQTALPQANAYLMVQRRSLAAGIQTQVGNHSFRATGGSPPNCATAARWRMQPLWRTRPAFVSLRSTTAAGTTLASMRSSGSGCDSCGADSSSLSSLHSGR